MKVVVTGSAGFIGAHAVRHLSTAGLDVLGIDLRSADLRHRVDLRSDVAVRTALRGFQPDAVVHLGALATVPGCEAEPEECLRTNVLGTLHLARATSALGARLVFASSAAVYGDRAPLPTPVNAPKEPANLYGISKLAAEQVCREYAPDTAILRFFNVYGERCRRSYVIPDLIRRLAKQPRELKLVGTGRESRDFVYIGDVLRAIELAVRGRFRGTYNVGSGRRTALRTLATRLAAAMGQPKMPVRFAGSRPGDFVANHADISGRNSVPGWSPHMSLASGLRRTIEGT